MSHFIKTIQLIDLSQLKDLLIEFELNSVEYNSDDDEDDEETKKNNLITSLREDIKCGTLGLLGKIDLETFFLNAVDIKLIKSKNKGILRKTLIKQLSHLSKLQKLVFNDRMSMQMVKMFPVCKKLTTIEFIWRREPDSRIFEILSTKFPNLTTIMINDEHGEHDFNPTLCISILAPQHLIINGHVKLDFSFLSSTKDSKLETFILKSTCTTHSNLIALFSGIGKSLTHCHIHKIECLEEDGDDGSETFYTVIDSIAKNVPKLESLMIDHSWKDVPLKIIESLCKKTKLKRLVKGMDLNELSESACTLFQKYGVDYGNWSLFGMFSSGIQDAFGRDFYNKFKSSGALSDFFETFQGVGGSQNDLDLITRLMSAIPIPETMQQLDFFHTEVLRQTQLQLNLQSSLAAQHSSGRVLVQPRTRQTASPLAIVSTTSTAPQTMSLTTSSTTMTLSTTSSTAAPLIPLTTSSTAAPLIPLTASSNAAQSSFTAQHHSSGRDLANPSASPTLPLIPLTTSSTTQLDFSSIDSSFFVFNAGASSTQQQPIQNVAGRPFARPRTRSISFTFPPAASPPAAKPQSPPDFTFDGSDAGFKF